MQKNMLWFIGNTVLLIGILLLGIYRPALQNSLTICFDVDLLLICCYCLFRYLKKHAGRGKFINGMVIGWCVAGMLLIGATTMQIHPYLPLCLFCYAVGSFVLSFVLDPWGK